MWDEYDYVACGFCKMKRYAVFVRSIWSLTPDEPAVPLNLLINAADSLWTAGPTKASGEALPSQQKRAYPPGQTRSYANKILNQKSDKMLSLKNASGTQN